jgi:hypothetical protein
MGGSGAADRPVALRCGPDCARLRSRGRDPARRLEHPAQAAEDPLRTAAVGIAGLLGGHRPGRGHRVVRPRPAVDPAARLGIGIRPAASRSCTSRSSPRHSGAATCRSSTAGARQRPLLAIAIAITLSANDCRPARGWGWGCSSRACCSSSDRGGSSSAASANDRSAAWPSPPDRRDDGDVLGARHGRGVTDAGLGLRGHPVADVHGRPGRPGVRPAASPVAGSPARAPLDLRTAVAGGF